MIDRLTHYSGCDCCSADCSELVNVRAPRRIISPRMEMETEPKDPQAISSQENARSERPKIRGFLIFVAFGLVLSFLQNLAVLVQSLAPFRGEVWEKLTTPGFSAYHPSWKPAIVFGMISSSVTLAATVISLVLFFRKHRFFPTFVVVAIPVIFVLMLAGYYLEGLVPAIATSPGHDEERHTLIIRFLAMHVWIPYFLTSERVKRTFVR